MSIFQSLEKLFTQTENLDRRLSQVEVELEKLKKSKPTQLTGTLEEEKHG